MDDSQRINKYASISEVILNPIRNDMDKLKKQKNRENISTFLVLGLKQWKRAQSMAPI